MPLRWLTVDIFSPHSTHHLLFARQKVYGRVLHAAVQFDHVTLFFFYILWCTDELTLLRVYMYITYMRVPKSMQRYQVYSVLENLTLLKLTLLIPLLGYQTLMHCINVYSIAVILYNEIDGIVAYLFII